MKDSMIQAYEETILDLKIEYNSTRWFQFKRRIELDILIEHFEKLLQEEIEKQNVVQEAY